MQKQTDWTDIEGARRAIIKDAAHHLVLEKHAEFNRVVLEFLRTTN